MVTATYLNQTDLTKLIQSMSPSEWLSCQRAAVKLLADDPATPGGIYAVHQGSIIMLDKSERRSAS